MPMDSEEVIARLRLKKIAYTRLHRGADDILQGGYTYWTERLLLRLVRHLAGVRLIQARAIEQDDELSQDKIGE